MEEHAWSLSLRRRVAFQWFLTAFSVRPVMTLAMSAHLQAVALYLFKPAFSSKIKVRG